MRGDSQTFVDLVLYYLSVIMYIVYWLESIEGLREGAKPKWVWENRDRITFLKNFVCLWWNAVFLVKLCSHKKSKKLKNIWWECLSFMFGKGGGFPNNSNYFALKKRNYFCMIWKLHCGLEWIWIYGSRFVEICSLHNCTVLVHQNKF